MNCPWTFLQSAALSFCESRRCAWIVEPSNALSNLGFVFVGLYLIWKFKDNRHLLLIGISALVVGITSGFYHLSATRLGEKFDLSSMCLLVSSTFIFNLERLGWTTRRWISIKALGLGIIAMIVMFLVEAIVLEAFMALLFATLLSELVIFLRIRSAQMKKDFKYRYLILALVSHSIAYGIWLLDYHHIWCSPNSWIQGHAVWHLLGAVTFVFIALFYKQFFSSEKAVGSLSSTESNLNS